MKNILRTLKLWLLDPISRSVKSNDLTYLSFSKLRSFARCSKELQNSRVDGDIYEFGIALGGSSIILAKQMQDRAFHGFDVFGMIPPPSENDEADTHARFEVIASGAAVGINGADYYGYDDKLYDRVVDNFKRYDLNVDGKRITLHRGLFEETLRPASETKIALVHIDCDWYDPVLFCLETIAPHLSEGGIIIVDDYNDYEGCRKATDLFLAQNPEFGMRRKRPHAVITRDVQ